MPWLIRGFQKIGSPFLGGVLDEEYSILPVGSIEMP